MSSSAISYVTNDLMLTTPAFSIIHISSLKYKNVSTYSQTHDWHNS